jgi:hypothetical protein
MCPDDSFAPNLAPIEYNREFIEISPGISATGGYGTKIITGGTRMIRLIYGSPRADDRSTIRPERDV